MFFVALKVFMCSCLGCATCACVHAAYIFCNVLLRILKTATHLKMDAIFETRKMNSPRIGALVVVYNRAVIQNQSSVRLVVAKDVIPSILAHYTVCRQKQCHPAPQHYLVFFESVSCKNSDTSCLESRRKLTE